MESNYLPKSQHDVLLAFLNGGVKFLLVGGHAFSAHAFVRATKDMDLWVEPTPENAERVWRALAGFGAPLNAHSIKVKDFHAPNQVYQLGVAPQRVDIITTVADLDFDDAWQRRLDVELDQLTIPVISLQDLIRAKEFAARDQDKLDVQALRRVQKRKKS